MKDFWGLEMLGRAKTVFVVVTFAAFLQFLICLPAFSKYSGQLEWALTMMAILGWVILAFTAPNGLLAFCGSVAISVPFISYSMLGYGPLEMGGFVHAFCGGGFGLACYFLVKRCKIRKQQPTPPI